MEKDISLRHLRVLDVLFTERSLTAAANVLDTSQPVLSKILARLRVDFDDPLFVRVGQTMEPTARALELAEPIRRILLASASLDRRSAPFDPMTSRRVFSFFISDVGALRLAPPLMERLQHEAPHVGIRMVSLDRRQLLPRLESGDVDMAIGAFPELVSGIRRRKLFVEGYRGLVRRSHPFTRKAPDQAAYRAARHVLVMARDTGHVHGEVEKLLETALPADRIALRVSGFVAAAMAVKRTDTVATIPANLADYLAEEFNLAKVTVPLATPRFDVALAWHERFHRDPAVRWMRPVLFEILGRRKPRPTAAQEA
ncbi:LysR family transcriptional regulator [Nitratireductor pacificus]|uniref:LysR family transcriptional regulator n=1 Tax=Nitratireductor pacificus pht-3B TaxID=391937 RepID=K2LK50_9HYPH|nr:LysR family transcriptional regulator [Nitratireductor pacificus]EKF18104.1 LysR family transcriptional regulator [Nitratireductor pacificus pht-3B]